MALIYLEFRRTQNYKGKKTIKIKMVDFNYLFTRTN